MWIVDKRASGSPRWFVSDQWLREDVVSRAAEIPGTDSPAPGVRAIPSLPYIAAPACIFFRERFAYCALARHISVAINTFLNPGVPCPLQGFRDNSFDRCLWQSASPLLRTYTSPISKLHPQRSPITSTRAVWFPLPLVAPQSLRPKTRGSLKHRWLTPQVRATSKIPSPHIARVLHAPSQARPWSGPRLCWKRPFTA